MYWNLMDKERLLKAFELANTPVLLEKLLTDLLTKKEITSLEKRLRAACMLKELATYKQIEQMTHLSSKTITFLSKKMSDRDSGLQKILRKFTSKEKSYWE